MRLNTIKPGAGSKRNRLRVGRGSSAGQGKTSGRGVKGQRARKGGYHKVGFEGGQMPLQRRMPKVGFRSAIKRRAPKCALSELNGIDAAVIDLAVLKKAGIVSVFAEQAKVVLSGELKKAVTLKGIGATKGAAEAITKLGGKIEAGDPVAPSKAVKREEVRNQRVVANPSAMSPAAALGDATRYGEIRGRLLFLIGALIVYRIGTFIPVPGIHPDRVAAVLQ